MRKLGLVIAIGLASIGLSGQSLALGLGEIEVKSFLNQPLQAEIEVISARPGEIDDLLVTLASRDAFMRAGLARPRHLSDLRFEVVKSESGDSATVLVSTQQSVKEPFLNFLIEADWSKGRVLREFTVLLDPPFYANMPDPADNAESDSGVAQAESAMVSGQASASMTEEPAATETSQPQPIATMTEETSAVEPSSDVPKPIADSPAEGTDSAESMESTETTVADSGDQFRASTFAVDKGDTLWSLASQIKTEEHSMGQIMLAFQRLNPEAFGNNNINNLKVGAVLRVPDVNEIEALTQQEAYAQVLEQNGLWDEYVAQVTGVAPSVTAEAGTSEGKPAGEQDGELSLLMPSEGASDSADSGQVNELRTQLALTEEELDAARVENAELESRISELQARLAKLEELQSMVKIEDDSLAQIQANQRKKAEQESAAAEQAASTQAASGEMTSNEEELLEELLAEEAEAQQAPEAVEESTPAGAPSDDGMVEDQVEAKPDESAKAESSSPETVAAQDAAVVEQATTSVDPPPAPVIVTAPPQPSSLLEDFLPPAVAALIPAALLGNPMILGAVGGLVVLILLLVLLKRRKGKDENESSILEDDEDDLLDDDEDELTPIHLAEPQDEPDPLMDTSQTEAMPEEPPVIEEAEEEDEFARTAIVQPGSMPAAEEAAPTTTAEQDDVLNEADVYLAYGLYDNAVDLLAGNLDETPDRADYRAKLLDTYFAVKNSDAFVKEAEILKSMGDVARPYWDRVQVMGYELAPDNALFSDAKDSGLSAADLEISKPQEADFDLGASEDDNEETNFSITDFNLAEETGGDFSESDSGGGDEMLDLDNFPDFGGDDASDDLNLDDVGSADDSLDFALPDELDLGAEETAAIETPVADALGLDSDADEQSAAGEDDVAIDLGDDLGIDFGLDDAADDMPAFEETAVVSAAGDDDDVSRLDLGTDDTSSIELDSDDDDVVLGVDGLDDELDISLGDFSDADSEEEARTGTFAPGDFGDSDSSADIDDIEDMMLPDDVDEVSTKLDLARAFIDMGDAEGARGSLKEVLAEGNAEQKAEAQSLLDQL